MKSKTEKILKIGAVSLFLFALFLNVNLSLNDPFNTISEIAIASVTTDSGTSGGTGNETGTSTEDQCVLQVTEKYVEQILFKWYIDGEVSWSATKPTDIGVEITGGVEFIKTTVLVTETIWGIEYICVGLGQCNRIYCYGA